MNDELFRKEGPSQEESDGAEHCFPCHFQKAWELSVSVPVAEDRLIGERHADRDNVCELMLVSLQNADAVRATEAMYRQMGAGFRHAEIREM